MLPQHLLQPPSTNPTTLSRSSSRSSPARARLVSAGAWNRTTDPASSPERCPLNLSITAGATYRTRHPGPASEPAPSVWTVRGGTTVTVSARVAKRLNAPMLRTAVRCRPPTRAARIVRARRCSCRPPLDEDPLSTLNKIERPGATYHSRFGESCRYPVRGRRSGVSTPPRSGEHRDPQVS